MPTLTTKWPVKTHLTQSQAFPHSTENGQRLRLRKIWERFLLSWKIISESTKNLSIYKKFTDWKKSSESISFTRHWTILRRPSFIQRRKNATGLSWTSNWVMGLSFLAVRCSPIPSSRSVKRRKRKEKRNDYICLSFFAEIFWKIWNEWSIWDFMINKRNYSK